MRLYLNGRKLGMDNAGYFSIKDIPGSRMKNRTLAKKLVEMGYIYRLVSDKFKIKSVHKLEDHPVHADLDPDVLSSKNKFKGWVLSVAEAYIARNNFRINKGWKKELDYRSKKFIRKQSVSGVQKFNDGSYATEIANSFLATLLGVSTRTISRWRKSSINKYEIKKILADSQYAFEEGKCFFDSKTNKFAQWSQKITTKVFIFFSGKNTLFLLI
jgi:hypothetical protein